jgi:hypothetical protein
MEQKTTNNEKLEEALHNNKKGMTAEGSQA